MDTRKRRFPPTTAPPTKTLIASCIPNNNGKRKRGDSNWKRNGHAEDNKLPFPPSPILLNNTPPIPLTLNIIGEREE